MTSSVRSVWTGHMGNTCAKRWVTLTPSQPTENPMPWRTQTVKEQRIELVTLARKPEANISELARRFGVSRKTIYKWLNRDDMDDRSRCPKNSPKRTPQAQEARIIAARDDHPAWGRAKLPTSSRATAASSSRRARSTASCAAMAGSALKPAVPRLRGSVSSICFLTTCGRWISKATSAQATRGAATR